MSAGQRTIAATAAAFVLGVVLGLVVAGGRSQTRVVSSVRAPLGTAERPDYIGEVGVPPAPTKLYRGGPHLVIPPKALTVPGVYPDGSVLSFKVPIRNDGTEPLVVKSLEPGCVCTQATARSRRLAPGGQTQIDVKFISAVAGPGRHGEIVHITTNDTKATRRYNKAPLDPFRSGFAFYISTDLPPSS